MTSHLPKRVFDAIVAKHKSRVDTNVVTVEAGAADAVKEIADQFVRNVAREIVRNIVNDKQLARTRP